MATMVHMDESESEEETDRGEKKESNSEKKGDNEVRRALKEEETEYYEGASVEENLVVKFGWCSLLFLVIFLIWIIMYFQDRLLQCEKINTRGSDPCTSIWHYGRGIILVTTTGIVWLCLVAWYVKPVEKTDFEERTKQRIQEEKKDKGEAEEALSQMIYQTPTPFPPPLPRVDNQVGAPTNAQTELQIVAQVEVQGTYHEVEIYVDSSGSEDEEIYRKRIEVVDLGSRLQKYWQLSDDKTTMCCSVKKSTLCKLTDAGFQEVSKLLSRLSHPYIQKIYSVECFEKDGSTQVLIAQPFWSRGSLRDLIHRVTDPMLDWKDKYKSDSGRPLPLNQVRKLGCQILEAMLYLYEQKFQGKPLCPLMQVQTGNVFIMDDDHCVLGGYENSLLGYRTSLYATLALHGLLEYSDIIMFGHVIFEMCTGRALNVVIPVQEDYDQISDDIYHDVVRYIFKTKKDLPSRDIKKIKNMEFFFGSVSTFKKVNEKVKQLGIEMSRRARAYSTHATEKMTQAFHIERKKNSTPRQEPRRERARSLSPRRLRAQADESKLALFFKKCSIKAERNRSRRNNRARSVDGRSDSGSLEEELTGAHKLDNASKSKKKRRKKKKNNNGISSGKSSETSGAEYNAEEVAEKSNLLSSSTSQSIQPSAVTVLDPQPELIPTLPKILPSSEVNEELTKINDAKSDFNKENQGHFKRCCAIFAVSSIVIICFLMILVLYAMSRKRNMDCLAEVSEESWWDTNPFRNYLPR